MKGQEEGSTLVPHHSKNPQETAAVKADTEEKKDQHYTPDQSHKSSSHITNSGYTLPIPYSHNFPSSIPPFAKRSREDSDTSYPRKKATGTTMSRGGRGGGGGFGGRGGLKGATWEHDPSISLDNKPSDLFPVNSFLSTTLYIAY